MLACLINFCHLIKFSLFLNLLFKRCLNNQRWHYSFSFNLNLGTIHINFLNLSNPMLNKILWSLSQFFLFILRIIFPTNIIITIFNILLWYRFYWIIWLVFTMRRTLLMGRIILVYHIILRSVTYVYFLKFQFMGFF